MRPVLALTAAMAALTAAILLVPSHVMAFSAHEDGGSVTASPSLAEGQQPARGGHVTFVADGQTVAANRPATVLLHFRVDPGFHINSHTPKSDMLIPTRLVVAMVAGDPEVSAVDFPTGTPFAFAFEPKQKLDVYQGEVVLTAHLKAAPGEHTLKAELRYQACDQAACYPPKTLAVEQPFTAK